MNGWTVVVVGYVTNTKGRDGKCGCTYRVNELLSMATVIAFAKTDFTHRSSSHHSGPCVCDYIG